MLITPLKLLNLQHHNALELVHKPPIILTHLTKSIPIKTNPQIPINLIVHPSQRESYPIDDKDNVSETGVEERIA